MLYGIVDCNNFFVSCERVFNPSLNGIPVVVLSNNDGCVIARSNEAKRLGIPMGCPAFQIKDHTNPDNVVMLSARHIVYSDLSHRIMSIVGSMVENVEVYSVDEAFFRMPTDDVERGHEMMVEMVQRIRREVGVPVSIGFAPTHTLCKVAVEAAKKHPSIKDGVYWLVRPEAIDIMLRRTPIDEVWGVGRRLAPSLSERGIKTAFDLAWLPPEVIRLNYNVTLERTARELRGEDCLRVNPVTMSRQSIMNSRTFGSILTDRREVADAVINFAERCAKHLRDENAVTATVIVHLRGDFFRKDLPYYANSCRMRISTPSASTTTIVHYALLAFNNIYRSGFGYRKAGVLVTDITPATGIQLSVFDTTDHTKQRNLMQAIDNINRELGEDLVQLVPQAAPDAKWRPKQDHRAAPSKTLRFYTAMPQ